MFEYRIVTRREEDWVPTLGVFYNSRDAEEQVARMIRNTPPECHARVAIQVREVSDWRMVAAP